MLIALTHGLVWLLAFGVPGVLLAYLLRIRKSPSDGLELSGIALVGGPTLVGWLFVALAIARDQALGGVDLALVSGTLTLVLGGGGFWLKRLPASGRHMRQVTAEDGVSRRAQRWILGGTVLIGVVWLLQYDRNLFQLNCVNRAATLVLGLGEQPNWDRTGYLLAGNRNVRLGNVCLAAPSFAAFGFVGPRIVYAWTGACLFLWGTLLGRRVLGSTAAGVLVGTLSALNPWVLGIPILDENLFAALLTTVLLASAAGRRDEPVGLGIWLGFIFGMLVGVRHIGLLLGPGLAWWLASRPRQNGGPTRWVWIAGAIVAMLTGALWAVHHEQVFGSPLGFESFEEYATLHPHSFLGIDFGFRGLLNAPFHEQWVRTPYNAAPGALLVLLWTLQRFGILLVGLWPVGLKRAGAGPLLAMAAPILLLMASLENLMQPNKVGIVLIVLPCLILPIAAGAEQMWRALRAGPDYRPLAVWGLACGLLVVCSLGMERWTAPADERVYALEDPVRRERPEYLEFERQRITGLHWLPDMTAAATYSPFEPGRKLADAGWDLSRRGSTHREVRPAAANIGTGEPLIHLAFDLTQPPIAGHDWVYTTAQADLTLDTAARFLIELPPLAWADLPATVGIAVRPDERIVDIALEFGSPAWFPDVPPDVPPTKLLLSTRMLSIAVPRGTTIRFTEVVADHFSRYYRWHVTTGEGLRVSAEPTVVFTN